MFIRTIDEQVITIRLARRSARPANHVDIESHGVAWVAFSDCLCLSADGWTDDAPVGSLDTGDEEEKEFTFDAPVVDEETIYTIVAYADSEEDEVEGNEVNNWSCDYLTIKPLIIEIETFNTLNIEVYPTLVDKEIFVISPSWQDVNISIINAVGQLVEPIITTENPNKLILNVSNLASGAYILIFNNGVNVQSNKFVIMH